MGKADKVPGLFVRSTYFRWIFGNRRSACKPSIHLLATGFGGLLKISSCGWWVWLELGMLQNLFDNGLSQTVHACEAKGFTVAHALSKVFYHRLIPDTILASAADFYAVSVRQYHFCQSVFAGVSMLRARIQSEQVWATDTGRCHINSCNDHFKFTCRPPISTSMAASDTLTDIAFPTWRMIYRSRQHLHV